jgi:hypothetical protein
VKILKKGMMPSLGILMLLLLTTVAIFNIEVHAQGTTIHVINPQTGDNKFIFYTNTTSIGAKFIANITLTDFVDVYTWQVRLLFNQTILKVTRAFYPSDHIFAGETTAPAAPVIDNNNGYVLAGNSLVGAVPGKSGDKARLLQIEFNITMAPQVGYLECNLKFFYGTGGTFLLNSEGSRITHNYENGYYRYEGPPPPKPRLEVYPAQITMHTMEEFNISVNIKQLAGELHLFAVQLKLCYNKTLLEVVNVAEGPFMKDPRWNKYGTYPIVIVENDYIIMGDMILPNATGYWDQTEFPNGEGTLFTVTFRPAYLAPASSEFTIEPLNGKFFIDVDNNVIQHGPPVPGTYQFMPISVPLLSVQPSKSTAYYVGELFNVNVTIHNLNALWKMVNVELKLQFNGSALKAQNVAEGPFMASFPTPPNTPENCTQFEYDIADNYVYIKIKLLPNATGQWTVFPEGEGTLATITFNATSRPPASCTLQVTDVMLKDLNGREIPSNKEDGYYMMVEVIEHKINIPPHLFVVETVSNTSVSPIVFNQRLRFIYFNVSGASGVTGFVNITIPNDLMWLENPTTDEWFVLVDGVKVTPVVSSNGTHTTLHFTIEFSSLKHVYIFATGFVPELPSILSIMALLTITLVATILLRSRQKTRARKISSTEFRENL